MAVYMIACEMLRDELLLAMSRTHMHLPVQWLEKGLHDTPQKLREDLQKKIQQMPKDCDLILLAMAYCGGAMDGLVSNTASLAVPRFDDCIRMLLSQNREKPLDARALYFTRQWIDSDRYLLRDLDRYVVRYGEKRAKAIQKVLLAHYRRYCLVDTGAYDISELEPLCRCDAERMGLSYSLEVGSICILEKLLRQSFDSEFCVVPPGTHLTREMFCAQPTSVPV